jgi:hypothetical protein
MPLIEAHCMSLSTQAYLAVIGRDKPDLTARTNVRVMKRKVIAATSFLGCVAMTLGAVLGAMNPKPSGLSGTQATSPSRVILFVAGSTVKMQQLLGETDKEKHQPTLSLTETRYGIRGTDLGNSFEHNGRVYFLFGDTVGRLDRALDTIATTDATDPEQGVRLDFLMAGRDYLTIQPPGISMGAFEVPVAGVSLGGQMYVAISTDHSLIELRIVPC